MDSINATDLFDNEFFDWIYIDTDHSYETTYKELNSWSSKIKQDGVIAGHDYMEYFEGCKKAVDEVVGKPDKIFRDFSWIKKI